jgi:hypothetical protein
MQPLINTKWMMEISSQAFSNFIASPLIVTERNILIWFQTNVVGMKLEVQIRTLQNLSPMDGYDFLKICLQGTVLINSDLSSKYCDRLRTLINHW